MAYSSGMKRAASFIGHITTQVVATKRAGSDTLVKLFSDVKNGVECPSHSRRTLLSGPHSSTDLGKNYQFRRPSSDGGGVIAQQRSCVHSCNVHSSCFPLRPCSPFLCALCVNESKSRPRSLRLTTPHHRPSIGRNRRHGSGQRNCSFALHPVPVFLRALSCFSSAS